MRTSNLQERFTMEINSPSEPQAGSKNNRNLIIGVVAAIVLCCCCLVTGIGGYYLYQGYVQAQQVVQEFQEYEIPEFPTPVPFDQTDPNSQSIPEVSGFDFSGDVPSGGLSDDETRLTAWFSVQLIAAISGCETPTVDGTTINVVQQPDSRGVWVEEWNVNCGNGSFSPQKVTFTPENGIVNVEVEMPYP
jgi:hypothetical protein